MSQGWTSADIEALAIRRSGTAGKKEKTRALGRMKKGQMNKTEKLYAQYLETQKAANKILDYWFESHKYKIGTNACWYTPDFVVQLSTGEIEIHEVKGHWEEDALVKVKALALNYPYKVIAVKWVKSAWEIRGFE